MAAILFTDVVRYSLLSNAHQKQVAQELNESWGRIPSLGSVPKKALLVPT